MPALQIRDLDQEIYDRLAAVAKKERRSMAQQAETILETALCANGAEKPAWKLQEEERIARRAEWLEWARNLPPFPMPDDFPSDVELIREDRDNR